MTWLGKKPILARLGITGFVSEQHFDEWYSELDEGPVKKRIRKAVCEADEYGVPHLNWNRNYFSTNKIKQWQTS